MVKVKSFFLQVNLLKNRLTVLKTFNVRRFTRDFDYILDKREIFLHFTF